MSREGLASRGCKCGLAILASHTHMLWVIIACACNLQAAESPAAMKEFLVESVAYTTIESRRATVSKYDLMQRGALDERLRKHGVSCEAIEERLGKSADKSVPQMLEALFDLLPEPSASSGRQMVAQVDRESCV